jgi:hypothetical protein
MLRTHYRSPFNFSDANLDDARRAAPPVHRAGPAWGRGAGGQHRHRLVAARPPPSRPRWTTTSTRRRVAVLFELASEVNRGRRRDRRCCCKALGGTLGVLQQRAARLPAGGGAGLDDAAIQALIAAARRGQGRAQLRRGRPHPCRAGGAGHRAEGLGPGHHLGPGLTMPRRPQAAAAVCRRSRAHRTPAYWDEACKHLAGATGS